LDLLTPTSFIEFDHDIRRFSIEVGWWIVEREVPVFANPDQRNINCGRAKRVADTTDHILGLSCSIEQDMLRNASLVNQPLTKEATETSGVGRGEADVFVQVKHFNLLPVDSCSARKRFENLKLGYPGGCDQAGRTTGLYGLSQD
jgi:hypothetical protein